MSNHHESIARQRGETLVEFALSLTIFLMTLLGTMEFGIAVFRYNIISDLAQEGARYASVRGQNSGAMAASAANVKTFVSARALGIGTTTRVYGVNPATNACIIGAEVNPSTLIGGNGVCVRVTHTFQPLTQIIPLGSLPLSATAQMIMSR